MARKFTVLSRIFVAFAATVVLVGLVVSQQKTGDQAACEAVIGQYNRVLGLSHPSPSGLDALESANDRSAAMERLINTTLPEAHAIATSNLIIERLTNAMTASDIDVGIGNVASACKISGVPVYIDYPSQYEYPWW